MAELFQNWNKAELVTNHKLCFVIDWHIIY